MDSILFIILVLALIYAIMRHKLGSNKKVYWFLKEREGVSKGIILAVVFIALLSLGVSALAEGYIRAGVGYTKKEAPECRPGDVDNKLISDISVGYRAYITDNRQLMAGIEYNHESCFLNSDDKTKDAAVFYFEYTF